MKVITVSDWDANMNDMLRGRNEHEIYDMGYIDALDQIDDWVDAQPTLTLDDLRPKGRWEIIEDDYLWDSEQEDEYYVVLECECSVCKERVHYDKPNFCPNCGADMRGGGEDG